MEKTDGYSLKETSVIIERRRMIMKVLVSALFAVAVVIPQAQNFFGSLKPNFPG
jgi:hypothetical protein